MISDEFINPLPSKHYEQRFQPRKEDIRGVYFRDQTAIIHSRPFRRLKHKAQVFYSPNNDHVCTRIEHASHVASIAATIAKGLGLNKEMAYAIGLAHDLGHAPFGHIGEIVLNEKTSDIGGFFHEIFGLRVVDKLGNRGESLNLSYGVRDGIICHCGESPDKSLKPRGSMIDLNTINDKNNLPCSYEGCIARMADRIAYLGRDLEDALYGGYIGRTDIPAIIENELGKTNGEIIDTLVIDVIKTSQKEGEISLSQDKYQVLMELQDFSIKKIYNHDAIKRYEQYCRPIIERLFDHLGEIHSRWGWVIENYINSPIPLDKRYGGYLEKMKQLYEDEKASPKEIVRDYIAGMTDGYALKCMKEISFPEELCFDKR